MALRKPTFQSANGATETNHTGPERGQRNRQENEMTNAQANAKFLSSTDAATRAAVLENIAKHYGITLG